MDIARTGTTALTNMRNVSDPLRGLQQQLKIKLLRQQMHKLRRPRVILLQNLLLPLHLARAGKRTKDGERATVKERRANIDKHWLV